MGDHMTPRDFQRIERREQAKIQAAEEKIGAARERAEKCPPPESRRRATASDVVEGSVIWYEPHPMYADEGRWYWKIVSAVYDPGDDFKAYCADDGCRYGLDRAFVERKP